MSAQLRGGGVYRTQLLGAERPQRRPSWGASLTGRVLRGSCQTSLWFPFSIIPKGDDWPPEGDQWRALDGSSGIYRTLAWLMAVIRSLNPATVDESFHSDAHPTPRWYCDVLFGPVEHGPGAYAYHAGPERCA